MVYFVATPIGNLKDITLRALEVLESVDVIACEDTRNSLKLLNHFNIKKKLIAYHKFNENASSDGIINLCKEGKEVAVISDAGMPVVSDPGNVLIKKLIENDIKCTVIPGASACLSALLLSGLGVGVFTFVGFLDEQNKKRKQQIENVKNVNGCLIFYVSPYNVKKDIQFLYENLGNMRACLASEITKLHEKTYHFNLGEELDFEPRGEYVLVVENIQEQTKEVPKVSIKEQLQILIKEGMKKNDAIKQVAKQNNLPKSEVYKIAIDL